MKKRKNQQHKHLNTNEMIARRVINQFTHKEMLTPTLVYIWNAEIDELSDLFSEVLSLLPYDYLANYIRHSNLPDYFDQHLDMFLVPDGVLEASFRELCHRVSYYRLRKMRNHIDQLLAVNLVEVPNDSHK